MLSGTVAVSKLFDVYERIALIHKLYTELQFPVAIDEVHIEQLVRNTHIFTHYSVGAIGMSFVDRCRHIKADIPFSSWQAHCEWKANKTPLEAYKGQVRSEDELAAIGMGLYWLAKRT